MANNVELGADKDRKSLQHLTKHFVEIIRSRANGCLNLRDASELLDVKQKRRIYDITNVLEGIGLIQKISKNTVHWRGFKGGLRVRESSLTDELQYLQEKEKYIDKLCGFAKQNIRFTMQDTKTLAYATRDDLLKCFFGHSVLTVKGHNKVQRLPVMVDNEIIFGRGLKIASDSRPIEVLMATDEGKSLIQTSASDDWKAETPSGAGTAGGGSKRKSKLVPTMANTFFPDPTAVPDHFDVVNRGDEDKKSVLRRFQEYKETANLLLNIKTKNPIQHRRLRLRNYYQAKTPFVKLSENMDSDYIFSLYADEGISDLYDIPLPLTGAHLVAGENEELFDEEEDL